MPRGLTLDHGEEEETATIDVKICVGVVMNEKLSHLKQVDWCVFTVVDLGISNATAMNFKKTNRKITATLMNKASYIWVPPAKVLFLFHSALEFLTCISYDQWMRQQCTVKPQT